GQLLIEATTFGRSRLKDFAVLAPFKNQGKRSKIEFRLVPFTAVAFPAVGLEQWMNVALEKQLPRRLRDGLAGPNMLLAECADRHANSKNQRRSQHAKWRTAAPRPGQQTPAG